MPTTTTGRATDFITFSRTSNATVTGADGRIRWAGHNLLTNSESFDGWTTNYGVTVTANAIAAPNGTTTADRLVEQAINDTHFIGQNDRITTPSNTLVPHTLAVFAKADQRQYLNLSIEWSTNYVAATFDLSGGTVTSNRAGGTGTGNTSTITPVGSSGWYLCTLTGILGTAGSNGAVISISNVAVPTGSKASYLGNTSNGLYLWGAHLYRSDLGGMVLNPARGDAYYPTTPRNRLGFTEDFSNAVWVKNSTTVATNTEISPNGLQTADTLTASAGTGVIPRVADTASATTITNTVYTASIYAKPGTYQFLQIYINSQGTEWANYTLSGSGSASANGSATASITSVGNGWYRLSITYTAGGTDRLPLFMLAASASATRAQSWNPVGTETIHLWGAQLSDSASLDAYSPVYGAAVTSAAYYAPRLDYSGSSLAALGLLVEEQRTNVLLHTAAIDDVVWGKFNLNTSGTPAWVNVLTAPDGTLTADRIIEDTSTTSHGIAQNTTIAANVTITVSAFVKANGRNIAITAYTASHGLRATFNLSTLAITNGSYGSSTYTGASIVDVGNGWYRVSVSGIASSTEANPVIGINTASGTTLFYTGDGSSGFYLWGVQTEAGSFATSYIPNGAATSGATRTADVASVSTQAFPYSASASTLVANVSLLSVNTAGFKGLAAISDGTANNRIAIYQAASATSAWQIVSSGGGPAQANITPGNVSANTPFKLGTAVASNDAAAYLGGVAGTPDPTVTMPAAATIMYIGGNASGGEPLNGWVRQITYLPRRLPNADLAARTV